MQEHYYKFWRELIRPKSFEIEKESLTDAYGKFVVKPLERGYGVTIGNSLRRILLGSMLGSAVSAVRFEGVLHEFSTIPDVVEDVTDIILNLKQVRFKMYTPNTKTIRIEKNTEGPVTAADIQTDDQVEVLNPEQQTEFNSYHFQYTPGQFLIHLVGCFRDGVNKGLDLAMHHFCPIRKDEDCDDSYNYRLRYLY